jgi:putative transposase
MLRLAGHTLHAISRVVGCDKVAIATAGTPGIVVDATHLLACPWPSPLAPWAYAMSDYRRFYVPGGTYFFTVVTHHRRAMLTTELGRACLQKAMLEVASDHPYKTFAIVLLPDHFHVVWTLPRGDARYPLRWMRIKEEFTKNWIAAGGVELPQSRSRTKHRHRGVWQKRYWEHVVRDDDDLERCVDYIHWNPRKHNLVKRVRDWPYSTFHRFVANGQYDIDWGGTDPTPDWDEPEWGE